MPSNKTGVFRSTNFFGKKRNIFLVRKGNYFMVEIQPSVAKQQNNINSGYFEFIFLEQNGA